jgi:tetratricopeptide (TPR) repeat protein
MQIGDVWAAMEVSKSLLERKVMQGQLEEGLQQSKQHLLFYKEYGDPGGVATSYIYLGTIACEKGEYESARRYFTDAAAVITEIGNNGWSVEVAEHLARLDYLEGKIDAARAKYEAVLARIKDVPEDSFYGFFHTRYAQTSLNQNRRREAREALTIGLDVLQRTGRKMDTYIAYYGFAELARLEHHYSQALKNYHASLEAVYDGSIYIELPRIVGGIAKTKYAQLKLEKAAQLFGASESLRRQMGMVIHIVERPEYDKHLELLKSKMSVAEFESAWAEGAKMSLEDIYEYTMQESYRNTTS